MNHAPELKNNYREESVKEVNNNEVVNMDSGVRMTFKQKLIMAPILTAMAIAPSLPLAFSLAHKNESFHQEPQNKASSNLMVKEKIEVLPKHTITYSQDRAM